MTIFYYFENEWIWIDWYKFLMIYLIINSNDYIYYYSINFWNDLIIYTNYISYYYSINFKNDLIWIDWYELIDDLSLLAADSIIRLSMARCYNLFLYQFIVGITILIKSWLPVDERPSVRSVTSVTDSPKTKEELTKITIKSRNEITIKSR